MAVTFAQAAALQGDPIKRAALQIAHEVSNVFDRIYWEDITGNAYAYEKDRILPGTAFRAVNEAYTESTGVVNQATETLTILGGDADVDRFIQRVMTSAPEVQLANQTRMKLESAHATFIDTLFNGDVNIDAKSFDGLRKRLVGAQVIDSATPMNTDAFLTELDLLFARVHGGAPDVVYVNNIVLPRLKSLGRKAGGAEYVMSEITGKREWTWNGVPFLDAGEHWSGRQVLDSTQNDMYAIKLAKDVNQVGVLGITNGGLQAEDLGQLQEKPAHRVRVEMYAGVIVQGGKAAARLRNIQLA